MVFLNHIASVLFVLFVALSIPRSAAQAECPAFVPRPARRGRVRAPPSFSRSLGDARYIVHLEIDRLDFSQPRLLTLYIRFYKVFLDFFTSYNLILRWRLHQSCSHLGVPNTRSQNERNVRERFRYKCGRQTLYI